VRSERDEWVPLIRAAQGSDPSINPPASLVAAPPPAIHSAGHGGRSCLAQQALCVPMADLRDKWAPQIPAELQPLSVVPAAPCEAFSKKQRKFWLSRVGVSS
jgi:hypothetical protein